MFRSISVVAALLVTSVIGCDRPAERDQEKANQAQQDRNQAQRFIRGAQGNY